MNISWQIVNVLKNVAFVFLESSSGFRTVWDGNTFIWEEIHKTAGKLGDGSKLFPSRGRKIAKFTHLPVSLFSLKQLEKGNISCSF